MKREDFNPVEIEQLKNERTRLKKELDLHNSECWSGSCPRRQSNEKTPCIHLSECLDHYSYIWDSLTKVELRLDIWEKRLAIIDLEEENTELKNRIKALEENNENLKSHLMNIIIGNHPWEAE